MNAGKGLGTIDILIVIVYLAVVILIGKFASRRGRSEEGFFLAGRKLGAFFQFFLSFGNTADSNSAISTSSAVYQQGASGAWLTFAAVFLNPYYWFMGTWFRRARLITTADLFEDRFGTRGLGRLYALFQIGVAILYIGFANVVSYKITAGLFPNPLTPSLFYICFTGVVAAYIVMGGLTATAINESLQGILIVFFSIVLVPLGLDAVGGWHGLRANAAPAVFDIIGRSAQSRFTVWSVGALLFVTLVQVNAGMSMMTILGSAKSEFSARFGYVLGSYGKRLVTVLWILVGLIAIALYKTAGTTVDPDKIWGMMSKRLLGRGCLGLMVSGLLAGNMSLLGTQAMSVSALFARNLAGSFTSVLKKADPMRVGRFAIVGVLTLGITVASLMDNVVSIILLLLCVNLSFGASILLIFFWRRLTEAAVWACVIISSFLTIIVPFSVQCLESVRMDRNLTITAHAEVPGGVHPEQSTPIFFEKLTRREPNDPRSPLEGRGRFNAEAWLLDCVGVKVSDYTPGQLLAVQYVSDGIFPFLILFAVSCLTRPTDRERLDWFYGKMKTPVGDTEKLEAEAMAATQKDPRRFDDQKLLRHSAWEFTQWTVVDTVGFFSCCLASGALLVLLLTVLRTIAA